MSLILGELLNMLVIHHEKLNELLIRGEFGTEKYLELRTHISKIQDAIKAITDQQLTMISEKKVHSGQQS